MNHHQHHHQEEETMVVSEEYSFAAKPSVSAFTTSTSTSTSTTDETEATTTTTTTSTSPPPDATNAATSPPPSDATPPSQQQQQHQQQQQQQQNLVALDQVLEIDGPTEQQAMEAKKKKKQLQQLGHKLGGAFSKINIVKWIDDLEQDQSLADQLDRINQDTADEAERKEICRQAMEACLQTMREHLLEFLARHPQATYEEWIANLHPDNIDWKMEGLTQTPLIDHRFYVANSDHRILWNEHLNDLDNDQHMTPVRHFVAARSFQPPSTTTTPSQTTQPRQPDPFDTPAPPSASPPQPMDHPLSTVVSNDPPQVVDAGNTDVDLISL